MIKTDINYNSNKNSFLILMIFSYFQHFLGKNQVVKRILVVKKAKLAVLLHFPEILPSQIFKNFWDYICKSSQNVRNVFCQEKILENSAESVKYIGGGVYFLLKLNSLLMRATLYTKINSFADTF